MPQRQTTVHLHVLQPAKAWMRRRVGIMAYTALLLVAVALIARHDGWSGKRSSSRSRAASKARALASPKRHYESSREHAPARSRLRSVTQAYRVAADSSQLPPHRVLPLPCDCQHCEVRQSYSTSPPMPTLPFPTGTAPARESGIFHHDPFPSSTREDMLAPEPAAWLGVGRPPHRVGEYHVRVIIRVHHLQEAATHSLIWAMRAQPQAAQSQPGSPEFTVDFALVATEEQGLPVVHRIAEAEWRRVRDIDPLRSSDSLSVSPPAPDVFVADTTGSFYALASNRSAPYRCSAADEAEYYSKGGDYYVRLHCDYDNHAYYQATDVGMLDVLRGCAWCTHVLVTNSDNSYHPDFLLHALSPQADLVTTDFIDHGERVVVADWRWGEVDLGGVLASKAVVMKTGGFIASLPPDAGPQETHDNDYWFVHRGLELGATTALVHKLMFFHN
ncbi:hypothetical protein Naga_100119g17 [Nannochloropsis gaditana]|uniref:Uncharacterized protein n=1 Tax=Nannochloropsis gaditana TaxID=72520 RepID=W7U8U3_9STRA|nr:hypothetical protein Naga_100119g17 [Nannochloropsis gaditana]